MFHCLQVVLSRQRCPPQADARPDGAGLQRQRLREQRLGRRRPALFHVHLAERDQCGHVVRLQREGLLEGRRGLGEGAAGRVQVPEIVRPASVARRQRLRVAVERLGRVDVARRRQQVAHRAVRFAQRAGLVRTLDGRRQRRVSLADLVPYGGSHVGEIGQRGGPQRLPVGRVGHRFPGCGRAGFRGAAGHRGDHRPHQQPVVERRVAPRAARRWHGRA